MKKVRILQDKYYNHDELTEIMFNCRDAYPDLVDVESIGKSHQGRDLFLMTVTNKKTGSHDKKPAMFLSACVHAGEVSGTQVCLYLIDMLLNGYGKDKEISRILDKRTYYILPRINPDGAEAFLTTESESWGNGKDFPSVDGEAGLRRSDVDGDGMLLLMRKKDRNGEWKISDRDPRLMIQRESWEYGGEYYSIYPEGLLVGENPNPDSFKVLPREYQVNMNRNYPDGWDIDTSLSAGGDYPLSEPEAFAVATFMIGHKNIGTAMDMHTFGGVILRGFCYKPDSAFPVMDLTAFNHFGEFAKKISGYDTVNVFEKFTRPGDRLRRGALSDWSYENLGVMALATEIWNLAERAGVSRLDPNDYYPDQFKSEEEELKLLEWNDKYLEGKNFIPWRSYSHPDLGDVEIGGWNWKFTSKNPPLPFLEDECAKVAPIYIKQINMLPEVEVKSCCVSDEGADIVKVTLTVENGGYLPTYIMERAVENGTASTVKVELLPSGSCELIDGTSKRDYGHLKGRMRKDRNFYFGDPATSFPCKSASDTFLLRIKDRTVPVKFLISSDRGGSFVYEAKLDA